jgi:UDP-N-acetylglucosamine--N-acetylmuramyl-(pentapeptide) pyrophosphoryl-undecaprenol N-acetylglucosamine transferase
MNQYICYVAGKSGGHIIPALTHAQNEMRENPKVKVLFFSTNSPLDRSLLEHNKLIDVYQPLELGNVPRKNMLAWPRFMLHLVTVFFQTFRLLARHRPVKVVSMGGYISVPVCYVARLLRIPFEVYELNVVPGEAVKLLSKSAAVTHLCFASTRKYLPQAAHCQVSAYPLRYTEQDTVSRHVACEALGLDANKKIICVLGGSQGSRFVNELLQKYVLHSADAHESVIIHQTGVADVQGVKDFYQKQGVTALVFAYRNDIHQCYAAADVLVARAGAGTLFEILFFQKPAIIIPLETATTDHQKDNALTMQAEHPQFFTVLLHGDIDKNPTPFFERLGAFLPKKAV